MATPLGTNFSTDEKEVSQRNNKAVGSFAEQLVIEFDQAKYEECLSKGQLSPNSMRRHRRAYVAKTTIRGDQPSSETPKALSGPTQVSNET